MKLLELCTSPGFGGLELYAAKVARYYQREGVLRAAVVAEDTLLDERLREAGLPVRHLQPRSTYFPLLSALRLASWIRREAVDVLHLHARKDLPLAVFAKLLARRDLRLVYTRQMALTRPRRGPWHRFLYRRVDAYVTITRRLEADARRFLPLEEGRITTLYYGVPKPERPRVEACRAWLGAYGVPDNTFKVAIFGRIEPAKGQHLLIEAVSRLLEEELDIRLVIVGRAMSEAYLQELKQAVEQHGLSGRVHFAGFHPRPTEIMGCFDAVVLATKEETFGLVLAEAMRAGVAVVGSNAGGVPEIIEDGKTGLLFTSEDAEDLARCLHRLVTEPDFRRRLARAGEAFADRRFTEEGHFARLTGLLADR